MMGIRDTVHTVLSLKDSAEAVAKSSVFPHNPPPRPRSTDFPSATFADREVHTYGEQQEFRWALGLTHIHPKVVQTVTTWHSSPHQHSDHFLMKHFPHTNLTSGSPPLVLKHLYFSSFEITFPYFILAILVNTVFVFFLSYVHF